MRPLLVRVVILAVLLGTWSALRPAEVEGQWWWTCWTCRAAGGWAYCSPTSPPEGWDACEARTQDPYDWRRSYCAFGTHCGWVA